MTFFHRGGAYSSTDATSYGATIATLAGGGVLWITANCQGSSSVPSAPTLAMTGATFTLVRSDAVGADRVCVWYSQDYDAGTSVSLTFTTPALIGFHWTAEEQIPGKTSGGSPVVQTNFATGTATTASSTLAAGAGEMLGVLMLPGLSGATVPSTGTKLYEASGSAPTNAFTVYWHTSVSTTPSVSSISNAGAYGFIVLEAVASAPNQAEVAWASMVAPDPITQAEVAWAGLEVPDLPLPPEGQVAFARLEVPDAPAPPQPWDPAAECETLEYRNPAGETVRFRTLIGTVGRFMPPIGVTTIPTPAGHGSHYLGAAHLERPVVVPVAIPGPLDGRADLRTWARILDPSAGEGTLTVVEGSWAGRRLRCVYEAGLDEWAEINRRVNQGVLLFRAAWPYWEDSNEFTVDTDQDDTLHTWFPFLPLVFGASDAFSLFVVDNTGDVDAWPVITVYGPGEDVSVTNVTTGASWTVTGPLLPGSVLEVDHRPGHKTVRLDGVNAFDQLTETSSLWPLRRGVNQVEVGTIDTDVDTLITFTWRRNWLAA